MLSAEELIELEIRASEEIARLRAELDDESARADAAAIEPDKAIGRLSRLDAMQMQEVAKDARRRREARITALRCAVERMDAGSYGQCDACGGWIAYPRLEAQPESTLCASCAG